MSQTHKKKKKPSAVSAAAAAAPATETTTAKSPSVRQARRERAFESKRRQRQEWLLVGGVLLITAFAFFNSRDGQFVYDDRLQVLRNPTITRLANIPKMFVQSVCQFLNETD